MNFQFSLRIDLLPFLPYTCSHPLPLNIHGVKNPTLRYHNLCKVGEANFPVLSILFTESVENSTSTYSSIKYNKSWETETKLFYIPNRKPHQSKVTQDDIMSTSKRFPEKWLHKRTTKPVILIISRFCLVSTPFPSSPDIYQRDNTAYYTAIGIFLLSPI